MRRSAIAITVFILGCGGGKRPGTTGGTAEAPGGGPGVAAGGAGGAADAAPAGEDILAQVLAMNSDEFGKPPVQFKAGHATPMQAPAVRQTPRGFEVQMASRAPIATPAVYQGKVFVSGGFRSREFHAFQAANGKAAWSVSLDDDGPSTAACDRGTCVFNTESCTVFAVDAATGKQKWAWWLGDPLTSSPTIAGGRVFTSYPAHATADGKPRPPGATHALIALDLETGAIAWQMWLDSDVMSAPVAAGEFVYVTTFHGSILKLEQATGKVRYAIRARATSAPVIDLSSGIESMYYTRRGDAEAEAAGAEEMLIRADHNSPKTKYKANKKRAKYLDKTVQEKAAYTQQGSQNDAANGFGGGAPAAANPAAALENVGQASVANMQAFQGSRALHLGDRTVNTMGDEVVATSAETGEALWKFKLEGDVARDGGFLGTAPLAAGDSVLLATLAGVVVRLDPETGKARAKYEVGGRVRSQPVVADGWIYVGTEDGRLVAINTGDRKLTGWPMWGGDAARTGMQPARR